jgi:alanine dehydrogenase
MEVLLWSFKQKKITALAFEYIKDEDGSYPAVRSSVEIAGTPRY